MLPLAFTLIVGLLLGFVLGYAASGRDKTPPAVTALAPAPSPQPPAPQSPASGRAWSEQAVAQPPAAAPAGRGDVPPVPGDAPPATPSSPVPARRATAGSIVIRSTPSGAWVGTSQDDLKKIYKSLIIREVSHGADTGIVVRTNTGRGILFVFDTSKSVASMTAGDANYLISTFQTGAEFC